MVQLLQVKEQALRHPNSPTCYHALRMSGTAAASCGNRVFGSEPSRRFGILACLSDRHDVAFALLCGRGAERRATAASAGVGVRIGRSDYKPRRSFTDRVCERHLGDLGRGISSLGGPIAKLYPKPAPLGTPGPFAVTASRMPCWRAVSGLSTRKNEASCGEPPGDHPVTDR